MLQGLGAGRPGRLRAAPASSLPPQAAAPSGRSRAAPPAASQIRHVEGTFKRASFIVSSPKENRALTIRAPAVAPQDARKSHASSWRAVERLSGRDGREPNLSLEGAHMFT